MVGAIAMEYIWFLGLRPRAWYLYENKSQTCAFCCIRFSRYRLGFYAEIQIICEIFGLTNNVSHTPVGTFK